MSFLNLMQDNYEYKSLAKIMASNKAQIQNTSADKSNLSVIPMSASSSITIVQTNELFDINSDKQKLYKAFQRKGYFLPCIREATIDYFRDVISGKKKILKVENVKYVENIPKFRELSTLLIYDEIKDQHDILAYLPDYAKRHIPSKKFLFNVINTVRNGKLQQIIEKAYALRFEDRAKNQESYIQIIPEFLEIFKDPKLRAGHKGRAIQMLKISKKIRKQKKRELKA